MPLLERITNSLHNQHAPSHTDIDTQGQTHLQNLLIILRLRLLHLGRSTDVVLQIHAHMLPRAESFHEKVRSLANSHLVSIHPSKSHRRTRSYLTAISRGDRLVLTHRRPTRRPGPGTPDGVGSRGHRRCRTRRCRHLSFFPSSLPWTV